ncbi:multidrug effflux MFS transporter [uncultured Shewanella sp.]|uniref:multidrug effflux MFS transporter n=1 Tax=uncultured Shewanella sp. TaxID=173975 RepID=UPI00261A193B|nr:multidrug effflux MFS transporter [uncultured Shewanella sp.]
MTPKTIQSRSTFAVILILAPLIFSFALALDIYVPSIPAIKAYFNASQLTVQLTVSLFLLMAGLGQLLMGPLSDQFGRLRIIFSSITIFTIGSIICTLSTNINMLIMGRIVQAIGACGMMVSAFAIVRDLFSGDDCAKVYSFLNSTIALSPILAPIIGGYIEHWFNWRITFAALASISLMILLSVSITLNETLPMTKRTTMSTGLLKTYAHIFSNQTFFIFTMCASCGFAGFLTFFSSSSYIIISLLHITPDHFGFYFASLGIVFFIGSFISGFAAKKIGTFNTVFLGAILMTLSGLLMIGWYLYFGLSLFGFMGPMMLMGLGGAMLLGAGAGGAIEPFGEMAGTASALFGCCEFVFAFLISTFVLQWKVTSTLPLGLTLIILGCLATALCLMYRKIKPTNNLA